MTTFREFINEANKARVLANGVEKTHMTKYLRSDKEVFKATGTNQPTVTQIAELYAKSIMLADDVVIKYKPDDLDFVKEYERTFNKHYLRDDAEWKAMAQDMVKNGIKEPLIIRLSIKGDLVSGLLIEGNHRLALSKWAETKKTKLVLPVKFQYI